MLCTSNCKPLVCGLFGPHPHAHRTKFVMCGACTRTPFFAPARAPAPAHFFKKKFQINFLKFFFLVFLLKIKFFTKKKSVRTCGAHPHLRGAHARTRTHIFENFCAPLRTKIAAPARVRMRAHARTLKVWDLETFMKS